MVSSGLQSILSDTPLQRRGPQLNFRRAARARVSVIRGKVVGAAGGACTSPRVCPPPSPASRRRQRTCGRGGGSGVFCLRKGVISLFAKLKSQKKGRFSFSKPSRDALFSSRAFRCFTFRTLSFFFQNLFWVGKYGWRAHVGPCATPPTRTSGAVALSLRARLNPSSDLTENTR